MYKRILIATDGTALSNKAVSTGVELAVKLGADVVVLTVVPRYHHVSYFEGAILLPADDIENIENQWIASGKNVIEAAKKEALATGVQVKGVVGQSDSVAQCLLDTASQEACDLIMMASHGRKGLSRLLLGSETLDVLTHSNIAVLVLR